MSLISYNELCELVGRGVINANPANINGASIDLTLGDEVWIEDGDSRDLVVDLAAKEAPKMWRRTLDSDGVILQPGEFMLASTRETFNLPTHIAAEFKLKSSGARAGLGHLLAGWADPGWHGSVLTLELHNLCNNHALLLRPGMKIGQMVFWQCAPVPTDASYAVRGQYNGDRGATPSKGVR